jgi:hypothetical protein
MARHQKLEAYRDAYLTAAGVARRETPRDK